MPFVSFPHIGDVDAALRRLRLSAAYAGRDENGDPIYDHDKPKPMAVFRGKVKVHGTFAAIRFDPDGTYTVQSRTTEVTEGHMGFVAFVKELEASGTLSQIRHWAKAIAYGSRLGLAASKQPITVAGEWFGPGVVRGGTAVSHLKEKHWGIFQIIIGTVIDEVNDDRVFCSHLSGGGDLFGNPRLHIMDDFGTYVVTIDLADDVSVTDGIAKIIELTNAVDAVCPVGQKLLPNNNESKTGEGIVWLSQFDDPKTWFKSKGDAHSATKVRIIDPEEVARKSAAAKLAEQLACAARVQQAMDILNAAGIETLTKANTGEISRWVVNDALREGEEQIKAAGVDARAVNAALGRRAAFVFHALLSHEQQQQ